MQSNLDGWAAHGPETVDPVVRAHVYSLVSAIGGSGGEDDGRYVLGDDALACLRDIRRWLRLYDDKRQRLDVARCLAEANLVKGDLLEILASWPEDATEDHMRSKLAQACLEILVPITYPYNIEEENFKRNHHKHLNYLQLAQLGYKRDIIHHDGQILRAAVRIALPCMATPCRDRTPRDEGLIRFVLYFIRNVAEIAPPKNAVYDGDEAEVSRSSVIDALQNQDVFPFLLTIAANVKGDFPTQDVLVLEILFHMLKGVDPEQLFLEEEKLASKHTDELSDLIQKEKAMLASQARDAPSRHSRFGTMVWLQRDNGNMSTIFGQDGISSQDKAIRKMDSTKRWNKPKYRPRNVEEPGANDFDTKVTLSQSVRKYLHDFINEFLDSSFNPLFIHIRKAIESEADRVLGEHSRQYFYLVSWFLQAECLRRQSATQRAAAKGKQCAGKTPDSSPNDDNSFALVAGVLNQESFIALSRFMQRSMDDKAWQDLNAGMRCFTRVLLTVQEMADSPNEDDQEIAENIQNRIFYEGMTHDRMLALLRGYKYQGFGYLDSVTELAHVFLRLLERYSKQNVDMQVRIRSRARKKKRQSIPNNEDGDQEIEGDAEETRQAAERTSRERKFDFTRFATRFTNEDSVNTFVSLAKAYADLSSEQLKRAHRFFYRVAFKNELSVLLFRVDILHLFHKMIRGPGGLDPDMPGFKEWEELVRNVFRKVVKKLPDRPELVIEMLFKKIPGTVFYLEHGHDKAAMTRAPRAPAELEVKPGMDFHEQLGVAVGVLINQGKADALGWIKTILEKAAEEREAWKAEQEARKAPSQQQQQQQSLQDANQEQVASGSQITHRPNAEEKSADDDSSKPPSIAVHPDNDERRVALFKDNKLRLLLTLLGFLRLGELDDTEASWIIPSAIPSVDLREKLAFIRRFEFDPPVYDDGKSAEDFLRSKASAAAAARRRRAAMSEDEDGEEDFLFPAGGPTARQHTAEDALNELKSKRRRRRRKSGEDGDGEGDDSSDEAKAERAKKRRERDLEKRRKIKSDLFVHDSDDEDDAERDEAFFAKEAALRERMEDKYRRGLRTAPESGITAGKAKETKRKKRKSDSAEATARKGTKRRRTVQEEDDDEDEDVFGALDAASEGEDGSVSDLLDETDRAVLFGRESYGDEDEGTPLSSEPVQRDESVSDDEPEYLGELPKNSQERQDTAMPDAGDEDEDVPIRKPLRLRAGFVIDSDSE
ncbi:timeless protein-domain-containing protein [Lineolata rhizophorae]|uniref:Topoisomerase 1-associated factor 1 n=1 Tax=Lineolata rhizophorae TaxID=578093 RepID=A0A6A6P2J0_9PEZI|nr:timeless protein-domain-containing protein [Lineolata rhizophorae]